MLISIEQSWVISMISKNSNYVEVSNGSWSRFISGIKRIVKDFKVLFFDIEMKYQLKGICEL